MVIRLSDEKKPPGPRRDGERQTGLVLDERTRTKKPPMYKVLLHNDDYTTREFVVWVLQTVFHKNENDAIAIMSHVHNNGVGVAQMDRLRRWRRHTRGAGPDRPWQRQHGEAGGEGTGDP